MKGILRWNRFIVNRKKPVPRQFQRCSIGFTLIELMVVVAVISILASVAIPKFGNLMVRTQESSTKGALGSLRSALAIYYADQDGRFPAAGGMMSALTSGERYLDRVPESHIPRPGNHGRHISVTDFSGAYTDVGDWMYFPSTGAVSVNCTHDDSTSRLWHTW